GEVVLGIDCGWPDVKVYLDEKEQPREVEGMPKCHGLPRFWVLFAFILSKSVRQAVFLPAFNEFLEDYTFARRRYRRKWSRRWLALAFSIRTARMIGCCLSIQF